VLWAIHSGRFCVLWPEPTLIIIALVSEKVGWPEGTISRFHCVSDTLAKCHAD